MVLREKRDLPSFGDVDTGRKYFYFKNRNAFGLTKALFVIAFLAHLNLFDGIYPETNSF